MIFKAAICKGGIRQLGDKGIIDGTAHFISRLSMIVLVNVVLNRTFVVDSHWRFDNPCGSHLQSQSESYHVRLMVLNSGYWAVWSIGHFGVPKTLTFKMRPSAQPFLWKWVLFAWQWKIIFISKAEHVNLVLIQRSGGTRKWPCQSRCY